MPKKIHTPKQIDPFDEYGRMSPESWSTERLQPETFELLATAGALIAQRRSKCHYGPVLHYFVAPGIAAELCALADLPPREVHAYFEERYRPGGAWRTGTRSRR